MSPNDKFTILYYRICHLMVAMPTHQSVSQPHCSLILGASTVSNTRRYMVICGLSKSYLNGKDREPHILIYTRVLANENHMHFYVRTININSTTIISPPPHHRPSLMLMLGTELKTSHILDKVSPLS